MLSTVVAALVSVGVGQAQPDLKAEGAFGFPQAAATVLCDTPDLRVSSYTDGEHLYVQAILWGDGDDAQGETNDGRAIGDRSSLSIDADADGKATAEVDRQYSLDPWPSLAGLHYQIVFDERSSSGLKGDSRGRGRISYLEQGGKKVRVDSYLVPLAEIQRKAGEPVRIAYYGASPAPDTVVNSVGFARDTPYYAYHLPRAAWHGLALTPGPTAIDVQAVPEGRGTIAVTPRAPMPKIGAEPPEVSGGDWINWKGETAPSLKSLRGSVVVVEFWATWCGPCVEGIPHLNQLHAKYADRGVVMLSLTDQSRAHVEEFMQKTPMHYTVGVKSPTSDAYGVSGIPHAFVIGRDGTLAWSGHPAQPEFEQALERAAGTK